MFPPWFASQGGASWYGFDHPLNNSVFKFSGQVGAQLIEATSQRLRFSFLPASAATALSNSSDGSSSIANMTIDCYGEHAAPCSPRIQGFMLSWAFDVQDTGRGVVAVWLLC